MPWIESHTVLLRHRKLTELARGLRLKPVHCLGHLHALWHAALEQREDGDLSDWSDDFIAECAAFSGDAPTFVSLLRLHGWLDGGLLHDWLDYAGRYLMARYASKDRDRLVSIWKKYGKVYGERSGKKVSERQLKGKYEHFPGEVRLGELKTENDSVEKTPENLGVAWCFHSKRRRGRGSADDPVDADEFLIELARELGWRQIQLHDEICRKDRGKTETLGEFKFRLKKGVNGTGHAEPLTTSQMIEQMQEQRRRLGIA